MTTVGGGDGGLRVAIAGAGLMGRWHAYAARRQGAAVAAIVDPDLDRAKDLARRSGGAAVFDSMTAMSAVESVDVVHVCAPLSSHAALTLRALESGAHALVEKPLARSAKETGTVVEAAATAGLLVCPVHQFAFQRGIDRVAARLPSLGAARNIAFDIRSAGGEGQDADALDGIVADILPHPLSILRRLWPEEPLDPGAWQAVRAGPGEVAITGEFSGALLSIAVSMGARPTCCSLAVHGGRGSAEVDLFHDFAVFEEGTVSRAHKIARPFLRSGKALAAATANLTGRALRREPAYPGLSPLVGAFYAAVRADAPAPISTDDTLAVAVARDGLIQKAFPHLQEFLLSA
jgi:predicted dehydrogenase